MKCKTCETIILDAWISYNYDMPAQQCKKCLVLSKDIQLFSDGKGEGLWPLTIFLYIPITILVYYLWFTK